MALSIRDILEEIKSHVNQTKLLEIKYSEIDCDVYDFKPDPKNQYYYGVLCEEPGRNKPSISLCIKDSNVIGFINNNRSKYEKYLKNPHGFRVPMSGMLEIYRDKIQLKCTYIKLESISESHAYKIYNENQNFYKNFFKDKFNSSKDEEIKEKVRNELSKGKKIALIANDSSKGKDDFSNILYNNIHIASESIPLSTDNIEKQIKKLIDNDDISIICIIRGGGDLNRDLFIFEDKKILDAVVEAKKKGKIILCGIGHSTDELTIKKLADLSAITPSELARKINNILSTKKNKEEETQSLKSTIEEKDKEIQSLKWQRNFIAFALVTYVIVCVVYSWFF